MKIKELTAPRLIVSMGCCYDSGSSRRRSSRIRILIVRSNVVAGAVV